MDLKYLLGPIRKPNSRFSNPEMDPKFFLPCDARERARFGKLLGCCEGKGPARGPQEAEKAPEKQLASPPTASKML